jgi:hypothetical protein
MLKAKTIKVVRNEIYPDYEVFRLSSGKGISLKLIHTQNGKRGNLSWSVAANVALRA